MGQAGDPAYGTGDMMGPPSPSAPPSQAGMYATQGSTALSGLMTAWSQVQSGRTNAKIDEWNARIADIQAGNAVARGLDASNRLRGETRRRIGAQRAGYAGQGVIVGQGSAAEVVDQTQAVGEADARQIKANALMESWGFKVQASDARMRAALARNRGRSEAVGSLLTTGARIGEFTYDAKR